jgi:hypothetical protein
MAQELSLLELYKKLAEQQAIYGEKLDRVYDIFSGTLKFPTGVTNSNDAPGLWPDTGMNVYAILSEYNLAENFCTVGTLLNVGMGRYKYQIMVVQQDELHPVKNGKWYYRYSKASSNEWSGWKRFVYLYELTGGTDDKGNPIKDDNGKNITDTEDEKPGDNPHNHGGSGGSGDDGKIAIIADEANVAHKLKYPRKIELTNLISGSTMFDGSEDVKIDVTSDKVVPINIRLNADHPDYDTYRLLCTLPPSNTTTYDYVLIEGHIGGWAKDEGKAHITVCASNREGAFLNGLVLGTIRDCDIVAYNNIDGKLKIYLKTLKNGWADDIKLCIYGSAQVEINNVMEALSPSSIECWRLSRDCVKINGKNIDGNLTGVSNEANHAMNADKVMVNNEDSSQGYITATPQYGVFNTLICDTGVMLDKNKGSITAKTFVGNLQGNADTSTEADYSMEVKVNHNATKKGYVLGADGSSRCTPFYDDGVYLMDRPGGLHSDYINAISEDVEVLNVSRSLNAMAETNICHLNITTRYGGSNARIIMEGNPIYFGNINQARLAYDGTYLHSYSEFTAPKVHNAIYNDYAEFFPRGEETLPGDVVMLDLNSDKEQYIKATENAKCVIGVHSDSYGHIVGGVLATDGQTIEEANSDFIPVALSGRVRVNFVGKSEKGAKVVATDNGCARLYDSTKDCCDSVLGYLVESDDLTEKRRLKIKIK